MPENQDPSFIPADDPPGLHMAKTEAPGLAVDPFRPSVVTPDGSLVPTSPPSPSDQTPAPTPSDQTSPVPPPTDDEASAERSARIAALVGAGLGLVLLLLIFSKRKAK